VAAGVKGGRSYSTRLRREHADLTRRRVLEAARGLFIENGYEPVTMQAIAREARVAYQTVYAQFGNKLRLALELCASEFPHVGQTVNMLVEARDRRDPEAWLRIIGPFASRLYEPCAEILRFMRRSGEPHLLERYEEIQAGRLQLLGELGAQLERSGRLRAGLSARDAVDIAWMLAGPETYERLVLDRRWTPEAFESWLTGILVASLLEKAE
jgi:TetR/AcrR family transcriptional regulator, regulator of autoinduction and epiphytic fitness